MKYDALPAAPGSLRRYSPFAFLSVLFALVSLCPNLLAQDTPDKIHQFVGVASCASSNCHGGVSPRKSSPVLQNEYVTWFKRDRHAQAFKALLGSEARRIGWQLGIEHPEKDRTCLVCHATIAPDIKQGDRFHLEDGVGCESCHGAAGKWISTHTAKDATHKENVGNGMTALESPGARARLCLGCHQGDESHEFSHRLYGAGHPRLTFELDTYSTVQPAHWLDDADYRERKGHTDPLTVWYHGQLAASRTALLRFRNLRTEHGSLFPELSAFTCSSCHHDLTRKEFLFRDYRGNPGTPRLNLAPIEMLAITIFSRSRDRGKRLMELVAELSVGNEMDNHLQELGELIEAVEKSGQDTFDAEITLKALLEYGGNHESSYYETAEQLAMGIASAHAQLSSGGRRPAGLNQIFRTLENPESFNPRVFSESCRQYLRSIKK